MDYNVERIEQNEPNIKRKRMLCCLYAALGWRNDCKSCLLRAEFVQQCRK